jgi:hypothetical protein
MKACKLLENASLGPHELAIVYKAFDDAWEAVKSNYASNATSAELGRLRVANAVLTACRHGATDPDALKVEALKLMERWS